MSTASNLHQKEAGACKNKNTKLYINFPERGAEAQHICWHKENVIIFPPPPFHQLAMSTVESTINRNTVINRKTFFSQLCPNIHCPNKELESLRSEAADGSEEPVTQQQPQQQQQKKWEVRKWVLPSGNRRMITLPRHFLCSVWPLGKTWPPPRHP